MLQIAMPKFDTANGTVQLGQFGRAPIRAHIGFGLIALLLVLPYVMHGRVGMAFCGFLTVFASILIHELAHAEMGRRCGVTAQRIDLDFFGGVVTFWARASTMRKQFAITLAGPLSNLAIAIVCYALMHLVAEPYLPTMNVNGQVLWNHRAGPGFIEGALKFAAYLNTALFVINMLPAYPLDGGKLAWMAIANWTNAQRATLVVSALGTVLGALTFVVLILTVLAGWPVWTPPSFTVNWEALKSARQGYVVEP